ncbi:MAG: hypothetical protein WAL89_10505 [Candidatus Sulfotelmatobacter sp.]|jgi:hypothetical protein
MPTQAEIELAEEELAFAERAYRRTLHNLIAMAKLTLAANLQDTGALGGDTINKDGELLDPPLTPPMNA